MPHRCLVTGGTGFIGAHLVRRLVNHGWEVRVLARRGSVIGTRQEPIGQTQFISGDFCDEATLQTALEGVHTVFHYASTTKPASAPGISAVDVESNLLGTMRLLGMCPRAGVSRFVFASSGGTVYGVTDRRPTRETSPCNPICSHGIVKRGVESYIQILGRESGVRYTILRYSNPYGPQQRSDGKQGAVAAFATKILRDEEVHIWGDGTTIRDYIFIDDLIDATMAAVGSEAATNEIINVGSGVGLSVNGLIGVLEQVLGRKAVVRYLPSRGFDVPASVLAIEKARALLGWRPFTPLLIGLERTVEWLLKGEGVLRSRLVGHSDAGNSLGRANLERVLPLTSIP